MQIKNKILEVYVGSTSFTKQAYRLGDTPFSATLTNSNTMLIGYKKPLNSWYFELKTPNTNSVILTMQKWTGSVWEDMDTFDETNGFKDSGFINVESSTNDCKSQTLNNLDLYWYKVKLSGSSSAIELYGVNLLFGSLYDLKQRCSRDLSRYLPRGMQSHILAMEASREDILQRINNSGAFRYMDIDVRNFTQFDLLNYSELTNAWAYRTLYHIFKDMKDSDNDNYTQLRDEFSELYDAALRLFTGSLVSLDLNDNGKLDDKEKRLSIKTVQLER